MPIINTPPCPLLYVKLAFGIQILGPRTAFRGVGRCAAAGPQPWTGAFRTRPRGAEGRPLAGPGGRGRGPGAQLLLLLPAAKLPVTRSPRPPSLSSPISRRAQIRAGCIWPVGPSARPPSQGAAPALAWSEAGLLRTSDGLWGRHTPASSLPLAAHLPAPPASGFVATSHVRHVSFPLGPEPETNPNSHAA